METSTPRMPVTARETLRLKFADDTKIYHVVNSSTAVENLQSDLHNLVVWSNEWQMLFNIKIM